MQIEQVLAKIDSVPRKQSTLLIGIDGCGGSGKSTLARKLQESRHDAIIVHMDDFYFPSAEIIKGDPKDKPVGADFDWQRMLQVIVPLSEDKEGRYQRYDWSSDKLADWHTVPVGGIVIIEGVSAIRRELAEYYDLTIFVDCPYEVRLQRGLDRDGEGARDMWVKNWMVAEEMYVEAHKPHERADLVMDGTK
ncbi:uridine kinase [Neobacillus notoginsengisoli]|uniref:Uridine kinase n=1 Tax=Neobacillus notoginsengisoli TaxID=1578198 RepID=A0A417YW57_9BACI|nr:AAA family ATPase [Neobacillus notoginsengisoli]RHW41576.1 uridine kinase [Neobacillus notoginsengisoli]